MEMLVIALITIVAFAAVLVPLFRRRGGVEGDGFEDAAPIPDEAVESDADVVEPTPEQPAAPRPETGDASADELELEVQRYRAAVRAGTVCPKCGQANPADSAFCFDCGARLVREDAQEFE